MATCFYFQVISPCFIPQPNGPPILVNLPSYIYPNIGMMGGMLAAASNSPTSASILSNTPTSAILSPTTVTSSGISFIPTSTSSGTSSGISFIQTSSSNSGPVTSLPANLLPLHPVSFATSTPPSASVDTLVSDANSKVVVLRCIKYLVLLRSKFSPFGN